MIIINKIDTIMQVKVMLSFWLVYKKSHLQLYKSEEKMNFAIEIKIYGKMLYLLCSVYLFIFMEINPPKIT